LPAEVDKQATFINPVPSFYEANRIVILGLLYALVGLLLLGLIAAVVIYRRKNEEITQAHIRYRSCGASRLALCQWARLKAALPRHSSVRVSVTESVYHYPSP